MAKSLRSLSNSLESDSVVTLNSAHGTITTLLTNDQGTYSLETVMTVALFIIPLALAAFIGQDILGDYYRWTVDFLVWPR